MIQKMYTKQRQIPSGATQTRDNKLLCGRQNTGDNIKHIANT